MARTDGEQDAATFLAPGGAAGLRAALEAFELGCAMLLEQLRRENPTATEEEIEALFVKRVAERPPDAPGLRRAFPDA